MHYSSKTLARAFVEVAESKSGEALDSVSKNFIALLRKKGLSKKLSHIVTHIEKFEDKKVSRIRATITSADTLSDKDEKNIVSELKKAYKVKEVLIKTKKDKKLIAGTKIQIGWEIIDNSLKSRITQLKENIV